MGVCMRFHLNNKASFSLAGTALAAGLIFSAAGCDKTAPNDTATGDTTLPAAHTQAVDTSTTKQVQAGQAERAQAKPVKANRGRPEATPGAKLVFDTLIYDFGTVYDASPLEGVYNFKNEGTADLLITRVKPGCGCTSSNAADLENRIYKPGEGDQIKFTFRPKGHGVQNKTITVTSSNEEAPTVYLQLRAHVLPAVKLMSQAAQFGTIKAGTQGTASIQFQSRDKDFTIEQVELDDDAQVTWEFERLNVGSETDYPGVGQLIFKSDPNAPSGPLSEQVKITIKASVPESPDVTEHHFNAVVGGNILARFEFDPRFLRFPTTSPGEEVEARTIISHLDGESFKIERVEFDATGKPGDDFEVTFQEVEGSEGRHHELVLRGTCPPVGRSFRGALLVHTSLENHGPVTLRYNGIIRPVRTTATDPAGQRPR